MKIRNFFTIAVASLMLGGYAPGADKDPLLADFPDPRVVTKGDYELNTHYLYLRTNANYSPNFEKAGRAVRTVTYTLLNDSKATLMIGANPLVIKIKDYATNFFPKSDVQYECFPEVMEYTHKGAQYKFCAKVAQEERQRRVTLLLGGTELGQIGLQKNTDAGVIAAKADSKDYEIRWNYTTEQLKITVTPLSTPLDPNVSTTPSKITPTAYFLNVSVVEVNNGGKPTPPPSSDDDAARKAFGDPENQPVYIRTPEAYEKDKLYMLLDRNGNEVNVNGQPLKLNVVRLDSTVPKKRLTLNNLQKIPGIRQFVGTRGDTLALYVGSSPVPNGKITLPNGDGELVFDYDVGGKQYTISLEYFKWDVSNFYDTDPKSQHIMDLFAKAVVENSKPTLPPSSDDDAARKVFGDPAKTPVYIKTLDIYEKDKLYTLLDANGKTLDIDGQPIKIEITRLEDMTPRAEKAKIDKDYQFAGTAGDGIKLYVGTSPVAKGEVTLTGDKGEPVFPYIAADGKKYNISLYYAQMNVADFYANGTMDQKIYRLAAKAVVENSTPPPPPSFDDDAARKVFGDPATMAVYVRTNDAYKKDGAYALLDASGKSFEVEGQPIKINVIRAGDAMPRSGKETTRSVYSFVGTAEDSIEVYAGSPLASIGKITLVPTGSYPVFPYTATSGKKYNIELSCRTMATGDFYEKDPKSQDVYAVFGMSVAEDKTTPPPPPSSGYNDDDARKVFGAPGKMPVYVRTIDAYKNNGTYRLSDVNGKAMDVNGEPLHLKFTHAQDMEPRAGKEKVTGGCQFAGTAADTMELYAGVTPVVNGKLTLTGDKADLAFDYTAADGTKYSISLYYGKINVSDFYQKAPTDQMVYRLTVKSVVENTGPKQSFGYDDTIAHNVFGNPHSKPIYIKTSQNYSTSGTYALLDANGKEVIIDGQALKFNFGRVNTVTPRTAVEKVTGNYQFAGTTADDLTLFWGSQLIKTPALKLTGDKGERAVEYLNPNDRKFKITLSYNTIDVSDFYDNPPKGQKVYQLTVQSVEQIKLTPAEMQAIFRR